MKKFLIIYLFVNSLLFAQNNNFISTDENSTFNKDKQMNIIKPIWITLGLHTAGMGFLHVVDGFASEYSSSNFKRAYTNPPTWDNDPFHVNYIAHPLSGSEYYLAARNSNWGIFGSFLFSTAGSVAWEYVFESWTEQPSTQDLIFTSTIGSIIGEIRYQIAKNTNKKWLKWIVDPMGQFIFEK